MTNLLVYAGGFAPTGGIETFIRDVLVELADPLGPCELLSWGRPPRESPLLREIVDRGVRVRHARWRWGCRWSLPDRLILGQGVAAVRRARLVLFTKVPEPRIRRELRIAADASPRRIPFVLVTPYRPAEMWPQRPEPGVLDAFEAILVQADTFADDLRGFGYRGRIEVVPLIPPRSGALAAMPPLRGGPIRIGFLGRLEPAKNLDYVFRALALLVQEVAPDKPWELHVFGDGSERGRLQQRAADPPLRGRVHFHGAIPHRRVSEAIDSCHMFVNASTTEGQCLVALEVLSRGRPLVATPVGALPALLADRCFGELAPLADARQFALTLGRVARAVESESLSPPRIRERFEAVYDRARVTSHYQRLFQELGGARTSLQPGSPVGS